MVGMIFLGLVTVLFLISLLSVLLIALA